MIIVNGVLPNISHFPNGETNLTLPDNLPSICDSFGYDIEVVWKFESDQEFMWIRQLSSYLKGMNDGEYANAKIKCSIPYFPYERMDRYSEGTNNSFTVIEAVDMLPKEWEYYILEPHSKVLMGALNSDRLKYHISYFNDFNDSIYGDFDPRGYDTTLYVLPDKGSINRYAETSIFNDTPVGKLKVALNRGAKVVVGSKTRDFDTGRIKSYDILQELVVNKDDNNQPIKLVYLNDIDYSKFNKVVVIDDLASYGGTFMLLKNEMSKLLDKDKVQWVLRVAHLELSAYRSGLLNEYQVHTTDSIAGLHELEGYNNYSVTLNKVKEVQHYDTIV